MLMNKKTKKKSGITLISLAITIIVLLILAGVTFSPLTGENGILNRATESKEKTEIAQIKEISELVKTSRIMDEETNYSEFDRNDLVTRIASAFEGAIKEGYTVLVENSRYSIRVDKDLNIIVEKYTGPILKEGELGIILTPSSTEDSIEGLRVIVQVKIGGMTPYEDCATEVLEDKTQEEKKQYVVEYLRYVLEYYYPNEEPSIDGVLKLYGVATVEELYTKLGYNSLEEYIISGRMVYIEEYEKKVTVTLPDGSTTAVSLRNGAISFGVYNNGEYLVTGTYEEQTKSNTIKISNIIDKNVYELAKEDENTYIINKIEDLVGLSNNVNNCIDTYKGKTVKLKNDLDFNDDNSYKNPNDKSFGDINDNGIVETIKTELTTGEGFVSIGIGSYYDSQAQVSFPKYFAGTFEGNNKTISNLYINNVKNVIEERYDSIGLFGMIIDDSIVQNLTVTGNIDVSSNESGKFVGAIVACNDGGNVKNCNNYANVNAKYEGEVGDMYQGGIVGYNSYTTSIISECNNYGDIKIESIGGDSRRPYIGGINGYNYGTIEKCSNYGNITNAAEGGFIYVAGINAMNFRGTVKECYNAGEILNSGTVLDKYTIDSSDTGYCRAAGVVTSNTGGGGIVDNCYNLGSVTNNGNFNVQVAGIVSYNSSGSQVKNSYNIGVINVTNGSMAAIVCSSGGKTENNYYLEGSCEQGTGRGEIGTTVKIESEMKTQEFLDLLQNGQTGIWKIESDKNNGYPILSWQK